VSTYEYIIAYLLLGIIFTLLNIDYRARFSVAGVPLLLFTILIWPLLLLARIIVTIKRIFFTSS
jgi:hypothetical protein